MALHTRTESVHLKVCDMLGERGSLPSLAADTVAVSKDTAVAMVWSAALHEELCILRDQSEKTHELLIEMNNHLKRISGLS
jgi:hypothetical protein